MTKQEARDWIKKERARLGITQIKLANMVGVTPLSISMWENGGYFPNPDHLEALKAIFEAKSTKAVE